MNKIITSLGIAAHVGMSISQLTAQEKKMNVLFIAVDDLKPILGCYGDKLVKTPNIDRLAKRGTVFMTNYCQQAVSGPTRASLMTGMRPDYTGVWDLATKMRDVNPDIISLPQYLVSQGYQTTGIGKVYDPRCVDDALDKPSWSIPYNKGSDKYFPETTGKPEGGYQLPETKALFAKYRAEGQAKGLKGTVLNDYIAKFVKPSVECADVPDNAYNDGANVLHAKDILAELGKGGKPFFFAVGFSKPHLPFVAPKKYWDLYDRKSMPLAAYQEKAKNGPDIGYHTAAELNAYSDIPPIASFSDQKVGMTLPVDKQKELIHGYYAATSYTDAQIGILLRALDSLGLSKNTIIVLWGDHGWHLGDHNLWCKHTNFEQATHAPLLISSPGINPSVTWSPSEFVDIFPTLCDLTGVAIPSHLDGKSLVPVMKDPKKSVKDFAVSQYPRPENKMETARLGWSKGEYMGYSFRTEQYRYTVWLKDYFRSTKPFNKDMIVATELYDYKKDPDERVNVAGEKAYAGVVKKMDTYMSGFFAGQVRVSDLSPMKARIVSYEKETVIGKADRIINEKPVTVTAFSCERSAGGKHDFFSEGPYWWPDKTNPDGPYIRKDGLRNPENFTSHDDALIRFSDIVATSTSAWLLTGEVKYIITAMQHLNAWFNDTTTRMNPNMLYAQAIKGICTGRGVGIIDANPLIDISGSVRIIEKTPYVSASEIEGIKNWFRQFLVWLTTHQYGIDELNAKNNHATWCLAQITAYSLLTGDASLLSECKDRYREIILPGQMAADGSFPLELARTKPYSYSLFNLDAMALFAWMLPENNYELWNFTLKDGRGLNKGLDYMLPYLKDISKWPHPKDVADWDKQPGQRNFMIFAALAGNNPGWLSMWESLGRKNDKNINFTERVHPVIWLDIKK